MLCGHHVVSCLAPFVHCCLKKDIRLSRKKNARQHTLFWFLIKAYYCCVGGGGERGGGKH